MNATSADAIPQLISYIAPAAPATRRPADGDEPFVRPEIGFTPAWYRQHLDIDFGEAFHADPAYRREAVITMRELLRSRFPGTRIGRADSPDEPLDLMTGVFGACSVAAIYGVPIVYAADNWPNCEHQYLSDDEMDRLEPPDLNTNLHLQRIIEQVDWIAASEGLVTGYVNWQGVLNNAQRLRGQQLFFDTVDHPDRARHLFGCITTTMIDAAKRLHARQRRSGFNVEFFTVSNCMVNMISPRQYADLLLPFDRLIAKAFGQFGIHNCAWTADPYLDHYATVPHMGYIDMGIESDLRRARDLFPHARRAIMYTPMEVANKSLDNIHEDFRRIAAEFGACDIVIPDIEAGTPDDRIMAAVELCRSLSCELERP
jgi:hypothetical protein